jgi:hypothetical protein
VFFKQFRTAGSAAFKVSVCRLCANSRQFIRSANLQIFGKLLISGKLYGATRRDRTGDLLITKNIRRLQTLH